MGCTREGGGWGGGDCSACLGSKKGRSAGASPAPTTAGRPTSRHPTPPIHIHNHTTAPPKPSFHTGVPLGRTCCVAQAMQGWGPWAAAQRCLASDRAWAGQEGASLQRPHHSCITHVVRLWHCSRPNPRGRLWAQSHRQALKSKPNLRVHVDSAAKMRSRGVVFVFLRSDPAVQMTDVDIQAALEARYKENEFTLENLVVRVEPFHALVCCPLLAGRSPL